jgi:hypothetical protein
MKYTEENVSFNNFLFSGNQLMANFSTLRSSFKDKLSHASALLLYRYLFFLP